MKVGIAGTGRMGAAIAARLAGLGHEVQVWNRTAARDRALAFPVVETAGKLPAQSGAPAMLKSRAAGRQRLLGRPAHWLRLGDSVDASGRPT